MLSSSASKYDSPIQGIGLVANQPIRANSTIWKISPNSEKISPEDVNALPEDKRDLVYQRGAHYYLEIDDSQHMNHSCDPNTWWVGDEMMVARRDIEAGEEITYDYSTSDANHWWQSEWTCRCGSSQCRGTITARDCLRPDFQEEFRGHLPSWVEEFISKNAGFSGLWNLFLYRLCFAKQRLFRKIFQRNR